MDIGTGDFIARYPQFNIYANFGDLYPGPQFFVAPSKYWLTLKSSVEWQNLLLFADIVGPVRCGKDLKFNDFSIAEVV
jgi:hypothetical protein